MPASVAVVLYSETTEPDSGSEQSIGANPPTCTVRVCGAPDAAASACNAVESSSDVTVGESQETLAAHGVAEAELLGGCADNSFDGRDWPPPLTAVTT